jgi:hypothetical protein
MHLRLKSNDTYIIYLCVHTFILICVYLVTQQLTEIKSFNKTRILALTLPRQH